MSFLSLQFCFCFFASFFKSFLALCCEFPILLYRTKFQYFYPIVVNFFLMDFWIFEFLQFFNVIFFFFYGFFLHLENESSFILLATSVNIIHFLISFILIWYNCFFHEFLYDFIFFFPRCFQFYECFAFLEIFKSDLI